MFEVPQAQAAIGQVLTDLSGQIMLYLGATLGIFAALIGLGLAINWIIKYITGNVSMGGEGTVGTGGTWTDHVNWEGKNALSGTGLDKDEAWFEGERHREDLGNKAAGLRYKEHYNAKLGHWFDD
jgi:hypothetical protein